MARQFARGKHAIAECQRGGHKMRYRDLVEDGHIPGLLVCNDCWEPQHPQEIPPEVNDPVALYRPAPEISIPAGYGLPETLDGQVVPTTPSGAATGVLATAMASGDKQVVVDSALTYDIGDWLFIELDASGYHVSRIVTTTTAPTFVIPFTTAITGAASIGNDFHVEAG